MSLPITVRDAELLATIKLASSDEAAHQIIASYRLELTVALSEELLSTRKALVRAQEKLSELTVGLSKHVGDLQALVKTAKE
jgi:hypothetical protein